MATSSEISTNILDKLNSLISSTTDPDALGALINQYEQTVSLIRDGYQFSETDLLNLPTVIRQEVQAQIADFGDLVFSEFGDAFSQMKKTLYVDQINGSDSNLGTFTSPKKTINACIRSVPYGGSVSVVFLSNYLNESLIDAGRFITFNLQDFNFTTTYGFASVPFHTTFKIYGAGSFVFQSNGSNPWEGNCLAWVSSSFDFIFGLSSATSNLTIDNFAHSSFIVVDGGLVRCQFSRVTLSGNPTTAVTVNRGGLKLMGTNYSVTNINWTL